MIIYKEDEEYPELLKQTKGAPKQLYYKYSRLNFFERFSPEGTPRVSKKSKTLAVYNSRSEFSERFTLKGSDASRKIQNAHFQSKSKALVSTEEPYTHQKFQNTRFLDGIFENCLAVIGSRRLTTYGERVMEQMVSEIAMAGITIVSGFMYGGDAAAHEAAIKAGGRTIAVMPCGIDLIHPAHQKKLYESILENKGLIVSEYKGDTKPALWTYPQRNRIVAGLSKALLVIEAGEKSGCLITANCAKKFGRKVFAVPGPITGSLSKGTNLLIKNGAEMVLSAGDVLKYYSAYSSRSEFPSRFIPQSGSPTRLRKIQNAHSKSSKAPVIHNSHPEFSERFIPSEREPYAHQKFQNTRSLLEDKILRKLEQEPMGIDELSRGLEMPVAELSVKLSLMEIKGLIKLRGNKYYVK